MNLRRSSQPANRARAPPRLWPVSQIGRSFFFRSASMASSSGSQMASIARTNPWWKRAADAGGGRSVPSRPSGTISRLPASVSSQSFSPSIVVGDSRAGKAATRWSSLAAT